MNQRINVPMLTIEDKKILTWFTINIICFYIIQFIHDSFHMKLEHYITIMGLFMWISIAPMFLFVVTNIKKKKLKYPIAKITLLILGWILVLSFLIGPVLAYLAAKNYL